MWISTAIAGFVALIAIVVVILDSRPPKKRPHH